MPREFNHDIEYDSVMADWKCIRRNTGEIEKRFRSLQKAMEWCDKKSRHLG